MSSRLCGWLAGWPSVWCHDAAGERRRVALCKLLLTRPDLLLLDEVGRRHDAYRHQHTLTHWLSCSPQPLWA